MCECLNETDPERLIEIGAPLDEYSGEAAAIVDMLQWNTTLVDLTNGLYEIWQAKFGTVVSVKDGIASEPYDHPGYQLPDLGETAAKVFYAVSPYLASLPK